MVALSGLSQQVKYCDRLKPLLWALHIIRHAAHHVVQGGTAFVIIVHTTRCSSANVCDVSKFSNTSIALV